MITLTKIIAGIWEYSEITKMNQNDLLILSAFDHKDSDCLSLEEKVLMSF